MHAGRRRTVVFCELNSGMQRDADALDSVGRLGDLSEELLRCFDLIECDLVVATPANSGCCNCETSCS